MTDANPETRLSAEDVRVSTDARGRTLPEYIEAWERFIEALEQGLLPTHYTSDELQNDLWIRLGLQEGFEHCGDEGQALLRPRIEQLDDRFRRATREGFLKSSLLVGEHKDLDWMGTR